MKTASNHIFFPKIQIEKSSRSTCTLPFSYSYTQPSGRTSILYTWNFSVSRFASIVIALLYDTTASEEYPPVTKAKTGFTAIRSGVFLFWLKVHRQFHDTFHQARSSQPGKRPHIAALHEIPGTLCIYSERCSK